VDRANAGGLDDHVSCIRPMIALPPTVEARSSRAANLPWLGAIIPRPNSAASIKAITYLARWLDKRGVFLPEQDY
jgi:hypothetical protein